MVSLVAFNPNAPGAVANRRRAILGKVHIAVKQLGIADDDYRAMLERVTGRRSAGDCDERQLGAVVRELERLGFKGAGSASRPRAEHPVATKARALWISLYQLGAIDDPSEKALEAFATRQLGTDRLQWADQREGYRLIEALKSIAERNGWSQRVTRTMTQGEQIRLLKDRLVAAQLDALQTAGRPATGPLAADRTGWSTKKLESAATELAALLRETRG